MQVNPYKHYFRPHVVGLSGERRHGGGRGGCLIESSETPTGLWWRGLDTEYTIAIQWYWLDAESVPVMHAVWRHQGGCKRPEPVKQKVRRHKVEAGYIRVGSEEVRLSRGPICSLTLYHPVAVRQLASLEWLSSSGPLGWWGVVVLCLWGRTIYIYIANTMGIV